MHYRPLLVLMFVLVACGLVAAAEEGDRRSLFDGKSLSGWKKTSFGGDEGEVSVEDGAIVLGAGKDLTGVTLTGPPPQGSYEIELDAARLDGKDFFCGLTFPVGDTACSLICGGWGGTIVGLSCIDGEDAATNETTRTMEFEKGRWYHVRLRVTDKRIAAWIDDKQLVDVNIDGRKIDVRFDIEASQPLGIATWRTKGAAKNIQWRPLGKDEV